MNFYGQVFIEIGGRSLLDFDDVEIRENDSPLKGQPLCGHVLRTSPFVGMYYKEPAHVV